MASEYKAITISNFGVQKASERVSYRSPPSQMVLLDPAI